MEIQSIITQIPKGSKVYVFGSYLTKIEPSDLDLLIVYDTEHCSPVRAYEYHQEIVGLIGAATGLQMDLVLLSNAEENGIGFIKREGCKELASVLPDSA